MAKTCTYCNKENNDDARYCISCGRQFAWQEPTQRIIIQPETYEDKLRLIQYLDWKKEYESAKLAGGSGVLLSIFGILAVTKAITGKSFITLGFISLGLGGLLIVGAKKEIKKPAYAVD